MAVVAQVSWSVGGRYGSHVYQNQDFGADAGRRYFLRPLHIIILADCSGSMTGAKIQSLNFAIAEMVQHLAAWEEAQEGVQILVRAIAFATAPRWHVPEPVPVVNLHWLPLTVVANGQTNMGPAFQLAASVLGQGQMPGRAFKPALVLITDGMPTDGEQSFDSGLDAIMSHRACR